ncbi:MAG: DUF1499 domain-containing protein [Pirellulaceae bacterium]
MPFLVYASDHRRAMIRPFKNRMWLLLYVLLGLAVFGVLAIAVVLLTHVEDWSRDLTTNHAATTLDSPLNPGDLARQTIAAVAEIPHWQLIDQATEAATIRLHFVRTTGLLRFQDDIRVRIEPAAGGSRLSAESRSRLGKGDLGQNPRNLRELLDRLRPGG